MKTNPAHRHDTGDSTAHTPVTKHGNAPATHPNAANTNSSAEGAINAVLETFADGLDSAFREAFSNQLVTGEDALILQAQKEARAAMSEVMGGNNLMRLSPEKLNAMQSDLNMLCKQIAHEAVGLTRDLRAPGANKQGRANIHRQLEHKISRLVDDFRFKHLGHAAQVDAEKAASLAHPKPPPH